jgi:hypothetical protein
VPSPNKLVVVNLRAQPVEIQHGGEVVVVPEFAHAELRELTEPQGQLAELAKQGAVAVQAPAAALRPAAPKPAAPKPAARPKRKPAAGGQKKKPPAKRPPPKSP